MLKYFLFNIAMISVSQSFNRWRQCISIIQQVAPVYLTGATCAKTTWMFPRTDSTLTVIWSSHTDVAVVAPILSRDWTAPDTQAVVSGWPESSQLDRGGIAYMYHHLQSQLYLLQCTLRNNNQLTYLLTCLSSNCSIVLTAYLPALVLHLLYRKFII